jgi:prolyl oligopeptidase
MGTSQKDKVILAEKRRYVGGSVTEDDHYLVITASTNLRKRTVKDLTKPDSPIVSIVDNFNSDKCYGQ